MQPLEELQAELKELDQRRATATTHQEREQIDSEVIERLLTIFKHHLSPQEQEELIARLMKEALRLS